MKEILERGPWRICTWKPETEGGKDRLVLCSDDFRHDVCLIITGDFADDEQKLNYARQLCSRMNRMPER